MASGPTVLIVNPNARGGWLGRKWPVLEPLLREPLGGFVVRFTTRPREGTDLCRAALDEGAGLVLALGGDGTASEVASGFLSGGPTEACFGYLPCGTGGDLRRTFDSPADLQEAARAIGLSSPRAIDAGLLEYTTREGRPARTHFINIASFGIGGLVDELANRSSKLLGGKLTFLHASLRASLRYKNARVRLRLDDGPTEEARIYNVAVANGRFFGGGMKIAPEAQVDDGMFDVVTLGDLGLMEAIGLSGAIYKGGHLGRPKVAARRARKLYAEPVEPGEAVLLDVDGEAPGRLPATFTVLPGALRLRV